MGEGWCQRRDAPWGAQPWFSQRRFPGGRASGEPQSAPDRCAWLPRLALVPGVAQRRGRGRALRWVPPCLASGEEHQAGGGDPADSGGGAWGRSLAAWVSQGEGYFAELRLELWRVTVRY